MDDNEFMRRQEEAVEKMREMNARAVKNGTGQNMPPVPPFVRLQGNRQNRTAQSPQRQRQYSAVNQPKNENAVSEKKEPQLPKTENKSAGFLSGLNIPFLDMLAGDADVSLIIGLMLILMSEKADKKLLFALVYILL